MPKILVVDDEPASLHSICRVFSDLETYHLQCADNGETALAAVEATAPDLVLLDILMPGIDGYEVCRRIKADQASAGTMVLLLSGKSELEDRMQGYAVQADDYITKPYDPDELRAKAAILLRLKKTQDELRELNRTLGSLVEQRTRALLDKERQAMIGQMIQGIVHNLRGPLTGSLGLASLVRDDCLDCLDQAGTTAPDLIPRLTTMADNLATVVEANEALNAMINDLLAKSRKEAVRKMTALSVNEILVKELKFLDADLRIKHRIEKELVLDEALPEIQGVYADFSQVFSNLILNAADAMACSSRKKLTIRSGFDGVCISIDVSDTGTGIAPEVRDRIFDPFFSTKNGTTDEPGPTHSGTGLGLYTCAEIVKGYGGEILARSLPGQGACFTVRIPVAGTSGGQGS